MSQSESPAPKPATPTPTARLLHATTAVLAATALGLVCFCLFALLALYELVPPWLTDGLNLAVPVLILAGMCVAIWKRTSLRVSLVVALGCAGFLIYLAWDDPVPPPEIVLAPLIPDDSKNYEAYRWMLNSSPDNRGSDDRAALGSLPSLPMKPEEWQAAVVTNRKVWEDAWEKETVGREWYAAMADHEPEGLYPNQGPAAPALQVQRIRRATQCHWVRAVLMQHDGDADEAARLLLQVVRGNYNLQRAGTTIATQAMASMNLNGTYKQLALLLDSAALSPDARDLITVVLRQAPPVRNVIALAFLGEEINVVASIGNMNSRPFRAINSVVPRDVTLVPRRFLDPFLFNPNRTAREHLVFMREASRLAQQKHQWGETESMRLFRQRIQQRRLKNPASKILATFYFPAFDAVIKSFWSNDEARLALLQRLEATPRLLPPAPVASHRANPLVLEILNPRAPNDNNGAFVTTVYLVRNVSDEIVTFSGGPKYSYSTSSGGAGAVGPMFMTGPTVSYIQYGYGVVSDLELQPGQACAFVSETEFGPSPGYALKVRFFRGDGGMMFDRAGRAAGLKYYVQFNLSYLTRPASQIFARTRPSAERKTIQLTAPSISIMP